MHYGAIAELQSDAVIVLWGTLLLSVWIVIISAIWWWQNKGHFDG